MYCSKCGNEISDDSNFCPKCGNKIGVPKENVIQSNNVNNVEEDKCIFCLKPTFNVGYKICTGGFAYLLMAIFLAIGVGIVRIAYIEDFIGGHVDVIDILDPFWFVVSIVLMIYIINLALDKKQHENLQYNFYKDRVEYKDGFLVRFEKEIKYANIREVQMNQGIAERFFNLGTITLYTSSGYVFFHCVENIDQNYKAIKEIINNKSL